MQHSPPRRYDDLTTEVPGWKNRSDTLFRECPLVVASPRAEYPQT